MPPRTALVIVDVQVNQFEGPFAVHEGDVLLRRVANLVARARAAGAPVVFVRNCGTAPDPDVPGTPGWELHPSLVPAPGEPVLDKTTFDTFASTSLEAELKARDVHAVAIAGLQSNYCIRATTNGALDRGFAVTLIANAHSTVAEGDMPAPAVSAAINEELAGRVRLALAEDFGFH